MRRRSECRWKGAFAQLALLAWVGAQVVCSAECWLGQCHSKESDDHASSHPASAKPHEHGENRDGVPANPSDANDFCSSFKAIPLAMADHPVLKPELALAWCLNPFASTTPAESEPFLLFRQAKRSDWAWTPAVCTGPANRSHAPPHFC
jgi:hypothetical protein